MPTTMFDGTNQLQLRAKDDLNNWSPTAAAYVKIDTKAPGVSTTTYTSALDPYSEVTKAVLWKDESFVSANTEANFNAETLSNGDQSFSWKLTNTSWQHSACSTATPWINASDVAANASIHVKVYTMDRNHTFDASGGTFGSAALRADSSGVDMAVATGSWNKYAGSWSGWSSNVTNFIGSGTPNTWFGLQKAFTLASQIEGTTKLMFSAVDKAGNRGYMGDVVDGLTSTDTGCTIDWRVDTVVGFPSSGNKYAIMVSTVASWSAYQRVGSDWVNRSESTNDTYSLYHAVKLYDATSGMGTIWYRYSTSGIPSGGYTQLTLGGEVQTDSSDLPSGTPAAQENTNTTWGVYKLGGSNMGASTGSGNAANTPSGGGLVTAYSNIQVQYKYYDFAGNDATTDRSYILLDRKPPTLASINPESGSWIAGNEGHTVQFTLTDDDSGIDISTIKYAILGTPSGSEMQLYSASTETAESNWTAISSQKLHTTTGAITSFDESAWNSPVSTVGTDGFQTVTCTTAGHYWAADLSTGQGRKIIIYAEDIAGNPTYHTSYLSDTYDWTITFGADETAPSITGLVMLDTTSALGGTEITGGEWTTELNPVFEWGSSDPQNNNIIGYSAILLVPGDAQALIPDQDADAPANDAILDTSDADETPTIDNQANGLWGTESP